MEAEPIPAVLLQVNSLSVNSSFINPCGLHYSCLVETVKTLHSMFEKCIDGSTDKRERMQIEAMSY